MVRRPVQLATLGFLVVLSCEALPTFPVQDEVFSPRLLVVPDTTILSAVADGDIRPSQSNLNAGGFMTIRVNVEEQRSRILLRFDSSAINQALSGRILQKAWLDFTVHLRANWTTGQYVRAYRLTHPWVENSATWACANDTNPGNGSLDCAAANQWLMDGAAGVRPFADTHTDSVFISNSGDDIVRYDVTTDVQLFRSGTPNHGWIIAKPDENSSGRVIFRAREDASNGPRLVLVTTAQLVVPAVPPDTVSAEHFADSLMVIEPRTGDRLSLVILMVEFTRGSTQPQRQAAIDSINGQVVGGVFEPMFGDGLYYVRVQHDGTLGPITAARATLRSLPQVVAAEIFGLARVRTSYLVTGDGAGWDTSSWSFMSDHASGENWNIEKINGPMAWSCATGAPAIRLAVFDQAFTTPAFDLSRSLTFVHAPNLHPSVSSRHGNAVTSVLAADASNGTGITGLLWTASIRAYDIFSDTAGSPVALPTGEPTVHPSHFFRFLSNAYQAGVRVFNLSVGLHWDYVPSLADTADVNRVWRTAFPILFFLRGLEFAGLEHPLIVVAAGNNATTEGADAFWSGYPAPVDSFPESVLPVAASDSTDDLWVESKRGSRVRHCNEITESSTCA